MKISIVISSIVASVLVSTSEAQLSYTAIDLGTFGGTYGIATSINNAGQVVGFANTTNDESSYAFVTTGGPLQIVGRTDSGYSEAYGINEAGDIVGRARFSYAEEQFGDFPALYSGSQTQRLGSSSNLYSGYARAINSSGIAVGDYEPNPSSPQALLLTPDTATVVTAFGGNYDVAHGINDAGLVVGNAIAAQSSVTRGFVFNSATGNTQVLPSLGGSQSAAYAINDSGQIAGSAELSSGGTSGLFFHAAIFSNGTVVDLSPGNTPSSVAYGINNLGQAVGVVFDFFPSGFVYKDGSLQSLSLLSGANITGANDINDFGQIAATGFVDGETRPFLLNPTTPNETSSGDSRNAKVVGGMGFAAVATQTGDGGFSTTLRLLDGTASANRNVITLIDDSAQFDLASDVVNITGTGSDVFVFDISYDESTAISLFGSEEETRLGWYDPSDNTWKNAVEGNLGGVALFAGDRAYNSATDFQLGTYGVDTINNTVWAVVNHNSEFAAITAVPEASTYAMYGVCGAIALLVYRRQRRLRQ